MHSDPADARPAPPRQDIYAKKPAGLRLPMIALIAIGAVAAFGTSIWYAYQYGVNQQVAANPPLIKADPGPTKLKPDDPGGMAVPDRDKLVYDRVTDSPPEPRTERLLPPPEEPLAKPDAPPPPPAIEQATDGAETDPATSVADATPPQPPSPAAETASDAAAGTAAGQEELPTATVDRLVAVAPAAAPPAPPPAASAPASQADAGETTGAAEPPKQVAVSPPPRPRPPAESPAKPRAETPAAAGSYRVQLASFRTSKAANDAWSKLRKSNISLLRDLTAHVTRVELGQKGTFYRLQAGSFAQEARARSVCTELKAHQVDCLVVRTN